MLDEDEAWAVYSTLAASCEMDTLGKPEAAALVMTLQDEALDLMRDICDHSS